MSRPSSAKPIASGFFVWRTPALSFDALLDWGSSLRTPENDEERESLIAAVGEDRGVLRARLREVLERPAVREALFVASPSLDERLPVWVRAPDSAKGRRIECALVRYFERMAARATPFGLFSATSMGRIGSETVLALEDGRRSRRRSRLDMHYLSKLVAELEKRPELRQRLSYRPNSSLYRAAGRYRYAEARLSGGNRSYHLVAVDESDYLEAALERARGGATPREIAEAICRVRPDVSLEEATEYVGELIDTQVLLSDIEPAVTGSEPLAELIGHLQQHASGRDAAAILEEARTELRSMDDSGPGIEVESYRRLAARLEPLPAPVELQKLLQVDLIKPAVAASLGEEPLSEILRGIEILRSLEPQARPEELTRFRDAFTQRYQDAEAPLAEVLDQEVGIEFGPNAREFADAAPLLADLGIAAGGNERSGLTWRPMHNLLLEKMLHARSEGAIEIALEQSDLKRMAASSPQELPPAFSVTATIAAASVRDVTLGRFRVLLHGGGGPSGAWMLGRFCDADETLRQAVENHLRAEETHAPDAVFAEVVHLPEGRMGNVLFRPVLRGYEIPFLGRSGAARERQIPLSDLTVSVSGGRIVLRSRRLGREIVPRLTSAHNFGNRSLPVYRFLCSLQAQGVARWLAWQWGPLQNADFLPRIRSGRLVLSRARWVVPRKELEALRKEDGPDRVRRVRRWRTTRQIPRLVLVSDADNELLVDLDNVLSIDAFADVAKKRPAVVLTEMFPGPDELLARGPEGRFVHEIVVPFVLSAEQGQRPSASTPATTVATERVADGERVAVAAETQRSFTPGSEWLYAKIYSGSSTADRILHQAVAPFARAYSSNGTTDRWFFIRYGDPEPHLRVRFHGRPDRLANELLPALHAALEPLRRDGLLWRLQLDTYEREIERYGGGLGIVVLESCFQIDSEAVLEIVGMLDGDAGADARWRLALYGYDRLMDDFGFDLDRRLTLARRMREMFGQELRIGKGHRIRLGNKFRAQRKTLERILAFEGTASDDDDLGPGLAVLRARSLKLAPLIARIRELSGTGRFSATLEDTLANLAHMFANRLLLSAHRPQELVLWDFLERIYQSRVARGVAHLSV